MSTASAQARPWLSVIMPTYNGAPFLRAALDSIVLQHDPEIEVLAIDDGSTDETLAILEAYASSLPLTTVAREHRGNWMANSNHGLALARGEFVAFLHQDDFWLAGRLGALRRALSTYPQATTLLHPSWYVDGAGNRVGHWPCPFSRAEQLLPRQQLVERLLVQNFVAMAAVVVQRRLAEQIGGLDQDLTYTADWDFWLKLARSGTTVYLPEALSCCRIHAVSQTMRLSRNREEFRRQLAETLNRHLAAYQAENARRAQKVARVAWFSVEANAAMAGWFTGHWVNPLPLACQWLRLGPTGWYRYFHDSAVAARVGSRLRALVVGRGRDRVRQALRKRSSPAPSSASR